MNMHTRFLMTFCAAFLAALGVGITFLPHEILTHVGAPSSSIVVLLMQMLGALYLGLAILNWMHRGSHIGGIYCRPVSMTNFFNFAVGGITLVKWILAEQLTIEFAVMALIYSLFAVWFGFVLFTHPAKKPT